MSGQEMIPEVSIVMPVYNGEKYLKDAVDSVIRQTFENWELIIVDDCSTDRTPEMVCCYQDKRLKYIKNQQNSGAAVSRNQGVSLAQGHWIAFLDSDDCWEPEKLEKQLKKATETGSEFLFTGSGFMDEAGERKEHILHVPEKIGYQELLKQNLISCSSVMIARKLVEQYPMGNAEHMHEDFAVWLKILKEKSMEAQGIDEPLLIYRISKGSKSGNKWKAAKMTFRVYRELGLHEWEAVYYWLHYVKRSLQKYRKLV